MSSYVSAREQKITGTPKEHKKIAMAIAVAVVVTLAASSLTNNAVIPAPVEAPAKNVGSTAQLLINNNETGTLENSGFMKKIEAAYPNNYKINAAGTVTAKIAAQTFYLLHPDNKQEVQTGKTEIKDQLLHELNTAGIAYNVKEGLSVWVIGWNQTLHVPLLY